jgi:hypothetical protein
MGVKGFINNHHKIYLQLKYLKAEFAGSSLVYQVSFFNAYGE